MKTREEIKEILRDAVLEHIQRKGIPKRFEDIEIDALDADSNEATIAKEIFNGGMEATIEIWFDDDENDLPPTGFRG